MATVRPSRAGPHLGWVLVLCALLAACTGTDPKSSSASGAASTTSGTAAVGGGEALATPPAMQPDDLVDLTLYFRAGEGAGAHLEPVVREVPVTDDLPRRAVELLLDGPTSDEAAVEAPLPVTTELRDLVVEGGTAAVDLSRAVLTDARQVGASPANEALGLAALANTLTEFSSVERVVVTVDGERTPDVAAFWGGWGMPDVLVRDESLVGTAAGEGDGLIDLASFTAEAQTTGAPGSPAVTATSVRVRERISYTRIMVELADAEDPARVAKVPPVRVRRTGEEIMLQVSDVVGVTAEQGQPSRLDLDPDRFTASSVAQDESSATLRVTLSPAVPRDFFLHSLTNPTRVVLDVRK